MPGGILINVPYRDSRETPNYDAWTDDVAYEIETGTLVLPCADGPPVVIRTHEPYTLKTRRYGGTKKGSPPLLPKPADDAVVLTNTITMPLPTPFQSAGSSEYVYVAGGVLTTLEPIDPYSDGAAYGTYPFQVMPQMQAAAEAEAGLPTQDALASLTYDPTLASYVYPSVLGIPPSLFDDTM